MEDVDNGHLQTHKAYEDDCQTVKKQNIDLLKYWLCSNQKKKK